MPLAEGHVPLPAQRQRSTRRARQDGQRPRRRPVRPLDDGTTESVRVIEFVWTAGNAIQPVLMLERELLD